MPPTAGSSTAEQPRFYYDFASPESYLVAERALHALGEVPEWIPVRLDEPVYRCEHELDAYREDVQRRARASMSSLYDSTSSAQRNDCDPTLTGIHSGTSPSACRARSATR